MSDVVLPCIVVGGGRIALGPAGEAGAEATFRVSVPVPWQAQTGRVWLRLQLRSIVLAEEGSSDARLSVLVNGFGRAVSVPMLHLREPIYLGRLGRGDTVDLELTGARAAEFEPLFLVDETPPPPAPPRPLWEALLRVVLDRVLR
jgi:hypothetical protein